MAYVQTVSARVFPANDWRALISGSADHKLVRDAVADATTWQKLKLGKVCTYAVLVSALTACKTCRTSCRHYGVGHGTLQNKVLGEKPEMRYLSCGPHRCLTLKSSLILQMSLEHLHILYTQDVAETEDAIKYVLFWLLRPPQDRET